MKNLTLFFLLVSILFFSCKKKENIVYDNLTVHLGDVIDNNYTGSILISDDEGKLLGTLPVYNNTIAEVDYQLPSDGGNIHLTLFEMEESSTFQESNVFRGKVFTNVSKSTVYIESKELPISSPMKSVYVHLDSSLEGFSDINISTRLMRRGMSNFNGTIMVPDDDPNVFFAIMKEGEDFWRYAIIPTNGETSLNITEADLIYQTPNVHFTSDININHWSLVIEGVRGNGNVSPFWNLHSSGNFPQWNPIYELLGEPNLILNPEVFSKFRTKMELESPDINMSGTFSLIHVGEEPLYSYTPELIPFQVVQSNAQQLKIQNTDAYSLFIAEWSKYIELPDGNKLRGSWKVFGNFDETFKLPEIPDFAKEILPVELTNGNLPIKKITGYKDTRLSTYSDFSETYIYNNQVWNSLQYPNYYDTEDATIEMITLWF